MTKYLLIEKQGVLSVEMVTSEEAEAMRHCKTCGGEGIVDCDKCGADIATCCARYCHDFIIPCPDCITVHSARETMTEAEIDKIELERRRNEQSI